LTDPNFLHQGEQVHLGYGIHSTRLTNPALDIDELQPVDLVRLSHLHEDHFDRVVVRKLNKTLPIVTTRKAAEVLATEGFTATYPLYTWQTLTVTKGESVLRIIAAPAQHGPGFLANLLPPVNGSILEFQTATGQMLLRMYITGDTIPFDRLKEIPQRYPDIDLALFHLGGTRVFGIYLTLNGKQGVEVLKLINPETTIPIHCNDYTVFKSPLSDFIKEVEKAGLNDRVRYLRIGETYSFEAPNMK
jgi:L-ascorbate metabolism protein UlaG (beta-lactamase superfamily)